MYKFEPWENMLIRGRFRATCNQQQPWVSLGCPKMPLTAKWGDSSVLSTARDLRSNNLKKTEYTDILKM